MRVTLLPIALLALGLQVSNLRAGEDRLECRVYDVTDLTTDVQDFPSCVVELPRPDAPIGPVIGGAPFGPARLIGPTCATIQEMIKTRVQPERLDPAMGVSIEERGGRLVIVQTPAIHREIAALFAKVREQSVQVVVKGLLVPSATLPRETIFTNDALMTWLGPKGTARALATPRLVCMNTQRTHVICARNYGYIRDMEVSGDTLDPVIASCYEGCVLDALPLLSFDRRSATVELRFTLSSNAVVNESSKITFAMPLAPASKGAITPDAPAIPIDTPKLDIGTIRTTVRVPTGSWMLAGMMQNPDAAAKERNLLLFVAAEPTEKKLIGAANDAGAPGQKSGGILLRSTVTVKGVGDPGKPEMRIFDVRDIASGVTDFHEQPEIGMRTPVADPFGNSQPQPNFVDTDIANLIKEKILVEQFTDPSMTVDVSNGKLIVFNRPGVHDAIARILDDLRKYMMPQVAVRTVLISAADVPAETIFDEDAVNALLAKEGNAAVNSSRFVCFNNQLAHANTGKSVSYVRDYDVSGTTYDPVVSSVFDGARLEARPIFSADRSATVLQLGFEFNSDVTKTKRSLGLANQAGAATKNMISTTDAIKNSTLLGPQYLAGLELENIAMNTSALRTQLVIPKGKWVLAASFSSGNPKMPKTMLLFVSADPVEEP